MLIYVKDKVLNTGYVVSLEIGTGDNLLPEDYEDGYVGYINYYTDRYIGHCMEDDGFEPDDNGMYLCTANDMQHIYNGNMGYLLPAIVKYIFGSDVTYTIMDEEINY